MDRLRDASGDRSDPDNTDDGRFQKGTIRVGTGDAALTHPVDASGVDYVEGSMQIGYVLEGFDGAVRSTGNVVSGDPGARGTDTAPELAGRFVLNPALGQWPSPSEAALSLVIAGVRWAIAAVGETRLGPDGTLIGNVTVFPNELPFELRDDDSLKGPFHVSTRLLQSTDSPETNAFAAAYIRPRILPAEMDKKRADFKRNLELIPIGLELHDNKELKEALLEGRDSLPMADSNRDYWVSYVQGAFQPSEARDLDPAGELWVFGHNVGGFSAKFGALIYVETMSDYKGRGRAFCIETTPPHELGHQFGLADNVDEHGIMTSGCLTVGRYFAAESLQLIRKNGLLP